MKKIFIALLTFVLMIIPIITFADTTSTLKQSSFKQNIVQLKDLPVMIENIKYTPNDSQVKKATYFVFDDKAKAEGVVYGFTNQNDLNVHLQNAVNERKKNIQNNTFVPQYIGWYSYFYQNANFGGLSFFRDYDQSQLFFYNDRISSMQAGSNHNWTVMYWDINYGGEQLWVQSHNELSYVGSHWNDEISSIRVID
ncbi:hypothetical protein V7457_29985 [Bacillus toyonensis]|uniref:hypothetical protein n=1 Tax=Bacillus toyonensis TaxID=155322 RepID=UPI002FFF70BC